MKRIANSVAVQTILYTVSGKQKLLIKDYQSSRMWNPDDYEVAYEGENNLSGYKYSKIKASKIINLETTDNVLVISICTKEDEY
jgi:hypothetical protein